MSDDVEELYDYTAVRSLPRATALVVRLGEPTLVLGGSQRRDVVVAESILPLRRRRGGGGLVLLQPDDIGVDWWIPAEDPRWSPDVHATSRLVGDWWAQVLTSRLSGTVELHEGGLEGDPSWRVACFAGRGPGEVFIDGRKAVGVTQWRVREGAFVSTVLHAHPSSALLQVLSEVPASLEDGLAHATVGSLAIDTDDVLDALISVCSPVDVRQLYLMA